MAKMVNFVIDTFFHSKKLGLKSARILLGKTSLRKNGKGTGVIWTNHQTKEQVWPSGKEEGKDNWVEAFYTSIQFKEGLASPSANVTH